MRFAALLIAPVLIAACGGNATSHAQTGAPPPARAAIRVSSPAPGKVLGAQPAGSRLHAVVRMAGSAARGQQLTVRAACGAIDCEGITFADSRGRWRTRVELYAPKRKGTIAVTLSYSDAAAGEAPTRVTLHLRRAPSTIPQAAPQSAPPTKSAPSTGGQAAPAAGSAYTGPRTMIVIGDSLAVGMASQLRAALPDWEVPIDGRVGRPLSEGMEVLSETDVPSGSRGAYAILAFSLFTNDDPGNVAGLDSAVRQSVSRLGPHGCAIWATIARPAQNGVSYKAANDRLLALANDPAYAGRLLIVPWKEQVTRHPGWLGKDKVHATAEGYAARAALYAEAAKSCAA